MKPSHFLLAFCLLVSLVVITKAVVAPKSGRTSFSVKESDNSYQISATYDPDKTRKVQHYLDEYLTRSGDASFKNAQIDATMTLNDKTIFYIKSSPGNLLIKFDKKRNPEKALGRFKKLAEKLRELLTDK
ncbi:hypothetical protein [Larkinella rosea]|uniref:DUF3568 family protein n=1 Tax=Larkinella rosea TaxID=2025312 RepID=A0A3P1BRI0_9BACT|nr:hypothetical protein [Larkinella rosea]RRB03681.1 hypothetical protein EHT25_09075 [Larkinella rosea]